jgi:hypothetical protein
LRKSYAQAANDFQKQLNSISLELVKLDGDLDVSTLKLSGPLCPVIYVRFAVAIEPSTINHRQIATSTIFTAAYWRA